MDSAVDVTQKDLLEVRESGTHSNEKVLMDLKKRTLVEKQLSIINFFFSFLEFYFW